MGKGKPENTKNTEHTENTGNPFAQLKANNFPDQKLDGKSGTSNKNTSYKIKKVKVPVSSTKEISTDDESSLFFANMASVQKLTSSVKENKKNKSHKTEQQKKLKNCEIFENFENSETCEHQKNDDNGDNEPNNNSFSQNNVQNLNDNHIESQKLLSQNTHFMTEKKIEKALNIKGDTQNTYNPFEVSQTFSETLSSQYKSNANITEKKSTFPPLNTIESKNKIQTTSEPIDKNKTNIDSEDDDLSLFFTEVSNVKNLHNKGREIAQAPVPTPVPAPPMPIVNPLQAFMDAKLEFALHSTEDYVEAHVLGLDLMTVGKLQARQYNPEAHIDLHGLNSEQAYTNLIGFFRNSYQRGLRSVLVVTGKGNNSVRGIPVLRNNVQEWFIKAPFKQVILAFCSAKIEDGGSGALYVLIRKQKKDYGTIQWDIKQTDPDFFL